jgi:hypothetical protein
MPLWRIFAHATTFSYEQRAALARDVTALYSVLPAFYVDVIFINTGEADVWVGGKPRTDFVRIAVEQIARKLLSEDTEEGMVQRKWWMNRINEVCGTVFQRWTEELWAASFEDDMINGTPEGHVRGKIIHDGKDS